jgi:c-di-GMP-binding flagellar brake protein YcgR
MGGERGEARAKPEPMGSQSERRQSARYPLDSGLVARPAGHRDRVIRGRILDLSRAGLSAVIAADLQLGDVLELQFGLPYAAKPVLMEAAVCNREGYRYGLEFVRVAPPQQELINRSCASLALLR